MAKYDDLTPSAQGHLCRIVGYARDLQTEVLSREYFDHSMTVYRSRDDTPLRDLPEDDLFYRGLAQREYIDLGSGQLGASATLRLCPRAYQAADFWALPSWRRRCANWAHDLAQERTLLTRILWHLASAGLAIFVAYLPEIIALVRHLLATP